MDRVGHIEIVLLLLYQSYLRLLKIFILRHFSVVISLFSLGLLRLIMVALLPPFHLLVHRLQLVLLGVCLGVGVRPIFHRIMDCSIFCGLVLCSDSSIWDCLCSYGECHSSSIRLSHYPAFATEVSAAYVGFEFPGRGANFAWLAFLDSDAPPPGLVPPDLYYGCCY